MPGYIVLITESYAPPGKVRVRVVGRDGKLTDSLDKAKRYATEAEARKESSELAAGWMPTIVPLDEGGGLPNLPWDAVATTTISEGGAS